MKHRCFKGFIFFITIAFVFATLVLSFADSTRYIYDDMNCVIRVESGSGCPEGYTYNSSTGKCESNPNCPTVGSYSNTNDRCEAVATYSYTCPTSGQTYTDQTTCNNNCVQTAWCSLNSVSASGIVSTSTTSFSIKGNGNKKRKAGQFY